VSVGVGVSVSSRGTAVPTCGLATQQTGKTCRGPVGGSSGRRNRGGVVTVSAAGERRGVGHLRRRASSLLRRPRRLRSGAAREG
jgi:hypothetical protein